MRSTTGFDDQFLPPPDDEQHGAQVQLATSMEQAALASDFGQAETRMNTGHAQQNVDHVGQVDGSEVAAPVSAEPVGWLRNERGLATGPATLDPLFLLGATQPHGYRATYSPVVYAAPVAAQAQPERPELQEARHDSAHAETESERVRALAYWLEQQTYEPEMLSCAAATLRALLARAQAQPLPDSLIPAAPDLEYLRSMADSTALPAFLRGQIAAAVKKLASRSSGNPGELPELPDIAPTDDWDAVLDDIRRYGDACYRAGQAQQDALVEIRDLFPAPAPGTELEYLWADAMSRPQGVLPYVKACIQAQQDADKADAGQEYNDGFSDGVILALQLMTMHGDYGGTQYCELLTAAGPNQIIERAIREGMWEMSGLSQTPIAVERRAAIDAARKEQP